MLILPPPFVLRPLSLSDLPAVAEIEKHSFPTPTREKVFHYELTENKLAHYQALLTQRVNEDEHLLGYAGYWLIADEVHISTIAVAPQRRRSGFGATLILNTFFMAYEHDAALVTLEVRENNFGAQNLYKSFRFESVGRRKRYYRDTGEDAILMTVFLRDNPNYKQFLNKKRMELTNQLAGAPL